MNSDAKSTISTPFKSNFQFKNYECTLSENGDWVDVTVGVGR
jgi:hypothetical protein